METSKILEYITEDEKGLLDKLKAFSFNDFNSQMKNLIKILLVMVEKAKQPFEVHQFLYRTIINVLPQILSNQSNLNEFVALLKTSSIPPYQNTTQLIREFIIGVEDRKFVDTEYKEVKISLEQLKVFKAELITVNVFFLESATKGNYSHGQIMTIFYSCVDRLEAERRVIIDKRAIDIIRGYLLYSPQEYIAWFIRPLYSGGISNIHPEYYQHVAEPFHEQIFKDEEFPIEDFFSRARELSTDKEMVDDVESFYNVLKARNAVDGNKSVEIKNPLTPNGLELKSKLHKGVRPELKV